MKKLILYLAAFCYASMIQAQTGYTTMDVTLSYTNCDDSFQTTDRGSGISVRAGKADGYGCWQVDKNAFYLEVPKGYVITEVKFNFIPSDLYSNSCNIDQCDNLAYNSTSKTWEQKDGAFSYFNMIKFRASEKACVRSVVITYHKHIFTKKTDFIAATCKATGIKASWTCIDCGKSYYDEAGAKEVAKDEDLILPIDPQNHPETLEEHAGVDATCLKDGIAHYWHCNHCNKNFADEEGTGDEIANVTISKELGSHLHLTFIAQRPATNTDIGYAMNHWHCSDCGKNFEDEACTKTIMGEVIIPPLWTTPPYLCFTANTAGSTVQLNKHNEPYEVILEYSTDDCISWTSVDFTQVSTTGTITLANIGDKVYFRHKGNEVAEGFGYNSNYYKFVMSGSIAASGNIMSLVDKMCNTTEIPSNRCFALLFRDCVSLTTAPELPAKNLIFGCYDNMFQGCTSLTAAPELPATTLDYDCYGLMFSNCTSLTTAPKLPATTLAKECYHNMFAGCTSLTEAPELPATTLATGCYSYMFDGCTNLIEAPELHATTLAEGCYYQMFKNCTSLTEAPELPATSLVKNCYTGMFAGCTNLIEAPELPATTLEEGCYCQMFKNCTSLTEAPELPATSLVNSCYKEMFASCTKLNKIKVGFAEWTPQDATADWVAGVADKGDFICPEGLRKIVGESKIPLTNWTVNGAHNEISLCFTANKAGSSVQLNKEVIEGEPVPVSLEYSNDGINWIAYSIGTKIILANTDDKVYFRHAGDEVATEFSSDSGWYRFSMSGSIAASGKVMSLVDKSGSTKTLSDYCFYGLFSGCTSLTKAPYLSATTLATGCYSNMFAGCTSLTTAPDLFATTLATECYSHMFAGCTSLNEAPELPATTLVNGCYKEMFAGCTKLNKIKVGFAEWTPQDATTDWVAGVADKGDFVCPDYMHLAFGPSNIPVHWIEPLYLCFTANTAGSTIQLFKHDEAYGARMEYSTDDCISWTSVDFAQVTTTGAITLANIGDRVYFRRTEEVEPEHNYLGNRHGYFNFVMSGSIAASGNIVSLLSKNYNWDAASCERCFAMLFRGCTSLTSAPKLPTRDLKPECFANMFQGCTNLTSAPELQATILTSGCYSNMFAGCTSLVSAPVLPATSLAENCYSQMFYGCTRLAEAPELPATTLTPGCYRGMFADCTSLETAPMLPATTLAENCYSQMFDACTGLTEAPRLSATTLATGCYSNMFAGCTSLETAPELPATTLAENCYSQMFDACTSLTEVPELPATTLVNGCYKEMFAGCTKLNKIKVKFTNWLPSDATTNWLKDVAYTGDFFGPDELSAVYGTSNIPGRWTFNGFARPYLCFRANTAGSTIRLDKHNEPYEVILEYSTDDCVSWTSVDFTQVNTTGTITLANVGDRVYFRHAEDEVAEGLGYNSNYYQFVMSGSIAASGNIMSLVDKTCKSETIPCQNCFAMMFSNCASLTSAPELPAATLTTECYHHMFRGCTNLTSAPELPATELTQNCYACMFAGCRSLKTAPKLPATTLEEGCYHSMFKDCSQLNMVKAPFTEWTPYATSDWLNGVASTGTFVCPDALDKTQTGANYIPEGWTIVFEAKAHQDPDHETNYYSTFYSSKNAYEVPSGVTAYTGVVDETTINSDVSVLNLTAIEGSVIPAGEAVILKGTQSQLYLPYTTTMAIKSTDNKLSGTDEATTLGANNYALSLGQHGVGFYLWENKTVGANKAYLNLADSSIKALTFVFEEESTTGINTVNDDENEDENLYDLKGVRVSDSYKGIVIKNGKKTLLR